MRSSTDKYRIQEHAKIWSIDEKIMEEAIWMIPLLAGSIPDLGLHSLVVNDKGTSLELDANGGLGVYAELIPRKASQ